MSIFSVCSGHRWNTFHLSVTNHDPSKAQVGPSKPPFRSHQSCTSDTQIWKASESNIQRCREIFRLHGALSQELLHLVVSFCHLVRHLLLDRIDRIDRMEAELDTKKLTNRLSNVEESLRILVGNPPQNTQSFAKPRSRRVRPEIMFSPDHFSILQGPSMSFNAMS